jgi:ATP-dependent Clp protease ATP-binding subunit ClpC
MSLPHATVLTQVLNEASDIAQATDQVLTSGHVLLAFFTVHNSAARFLKERKINEDYLLDLVQGKLTEAADVVADILKKAGKIAAGCGATETDCLHVLYAMTRDKRAKAYDLLDQPDIQISALRQKALSILTGAIPVWVAKEEVVSRNNPSHISRVQRSNRRSRRSVGSNLPRPGMSPAIQWTPPNIARSPKPASDKYESRSGRRLGGANSSGMTVEPLPMESSSDLKSKFDLDLSNKSQVHEIKIEDDPWALSSDQFPWLTSLGRNLSVEAGNEQLDHVMGRDQEIDTLIDVLGKRRANNPCLLGEPGVGKTAVVEALALRLVEDPPTEAMGSKIIVELDVGSLLIGTHLRGSFSEKLQGIKEEVQRSGRVIVFFDELHTLVGAGSTGDGAQDAANDLKAVLARGEFPCIGATTTDEWNQHIEPDPALKRRFYPVVIKEPSPDDAALMLDHVIGAYAEHHEIRYDDSAIKAACELSARFIHDRHLPDKAITLLDLAGSRAARARKEKVTREDIAKIIAEQADIPVERVLSSDRKRLLKLEQQLQGKIVGHENELKQICDVIRRNAAGFRSHRPQGNFLFLGPTGVGKTETAKAIATFLHGSADALLRFDLSEFGESHSVARLIGAPPGYVGHDSGGQLTEEIRKRPARVILFDEVEKAHRDVLLLFLQILDDGRLTDSHGRSVSFSETIIIMTSNLGSQEIRSQRRIGFGKEEDVSENICAIVLNEAQNQLAPELWARIEEPLVFAPLSIDEVCEVTRRLARASSDRLKKERGIHYELDEDAIEYLVHQGGFDAKLGARPMRHVLSRIVEAPIAARILEGRLHADECVTVSTTEQGTLAFLVGHDLESLSQRPRR